MVKMVGYERSLQAAGNYLISALLVRLVAELARRSRHLDPKAIGEQMLPYGYLYVANQGFFTVKFSTSATDAMAKRTAKGIA